VEMGGGVGKEDAQVHKRLVELELGLYGVREKVRVDEDVVGRAEGGVGLEEEGGGDLWAEERVSRCKNKTAGGWVGTYISLFAWPSASFFLASISPAIWFFFLHRYISVGVNVGWWRVSAHTVWHRVALVWSVACRVDILFM
jgi:hypothetical protein